MMKVGEVFVPGRSKKNAQRVLAAAEEAKVAVGLVKTTDGGYLVPSKVGAVLEGRKSTRRKKTTNGKVEEQ